MQNQPGSVSATPHMCIHTTTPFSPYSQALCIKNTCCFNAKPSERLTLALTCTSISNPNTQAQPPTACISFTNTKVRSTKSSHTIRSCCKNKRYDGGSADTEPTLMMCMLCGAQQSQQTEIKHLHINNVNNMNNTLYFLRTPVECSKLHSAISPVTLSRRSDGTKEREKSWNWDVSADVHALGHSAVAWPNAQQPQTRFHKLGLNCASFSLFCIRWNLQRKMSAAAVLSTNYCCASTVYASLQTQA